MDVYADLLFLINFSMDFLCLFLSAGLLHVKKSVWRMIAAAALGGVYSVVALFFEPVAWLALVIDLGVCLGMCAVCVAGKGVSFGRLLLFFGTYFGISALMGGGMTAVYHLLARADLPLGEVQEDGLSAWMFLALATLAALAATFGGRLFSRQSAARPCTVQVRMAGREWELTGLCDSGNLLCDPISGTPVIVVDRTRWLERMPEGLRRTIESEGRELEGSEGLHRMRIVPIKTAQGSGMAVALMPDEVQIKLQDGKVRAVHALIAPASHALAGDFQAIVPLTLLQ